MKNLLYQFLIALTINVIIYKVHYLQTPHPIRGVLICFSLLLIALISIYIHTFKNYNIKNNVFDVLSIICFVIGVGTFSYQYRIINLEDEVHEKNKKSKSVKINKKCVVLKKVSVYNVVEFQTDSEPLITSNNNKIDYDNFPTNWIALSQDMLKTFNKNAIFDFGDTVLLKCSDASMSGIFIIKDTMHKRKKCQADILCKDKHVGVDFNCELCEL